jgi:Flp pilus assembly protein TadD
MADYDAGRSWVPPLEDPYSSERTLVLLKDETAPSLGALRHAFPAFGGYEIRREADFVDADALITAIDEAGFSRVFFLNPYGNPHRLALYRGVRAAGRRFVVWDRGGLNDSWFFDSRGFLAESASYSPEYWDKPLAAGKDQAVQAWLKAHEEGETLERNGERIGAAVLRERLQAGDRTIVFAALQRPLDTATVYFSGPCGGADGFNRWLAYLAATLDPERYVVVAKKHPLEAEAPEIPGVSFADEETHMMDLIEVSQVLVTINSGVGLIALGSGKPVICCGDAYYAHPGLAVAVASPEALVAEVLSPALPNEEKRVRFFRYLIDEFYSFGKARYVFRKTRSGATSRLVSRIFFSSVCGLTQAPIVLGKRPGKVSITAPLYYAFGGKKAVRLAMMPLREIVENGREARRLADYDKAAEMFEVARSRAPENDNFSRQLLEIGVQRYGGPLEEMMSVSVKALMETAEEAFAARDFAEAVRLFEMLHLREPNDPRHLRRLAESYLNAGARDLAVCCLEKAQALRPENKAIARRLQEIRRPWHLLEIGVRGYGGPLEEMMRVSPKALAKKAEEAFAARDFTEAVRLFEMLHLREPKDPGHLRRLAESYLNAGARDLAVFSLEKALALKPDHKSVVRRLQEIHRPWHLLEIGVQGYGGPLEEMMRVSPKALAKKAEEAFAARDFTEADRLFEMLRLREPKDPGHLRRLAESYLNAGARGLAVRCLEEAHALKPENKAITRRLQEIRRPWHLLEIGAQGYGGPLEEMMRVPAKVLTKKAREAFAARDFTEAARIFEMLHLREPKDPGHLRCLAECYLKDGARRLAARCLEEALALKPGNGGIVRRLHEVCRPWWKRLYRKEKPFPVGSRI